MLQALLMLAIATPPTQQENFTLELQGKSIGKADYTFTESPGGHQGTAHYQYNLQADISVTRRADYTASWQLTRESSDIRAAGATQSLDLTAAHGQLAFRALSAGQDYAHDFPLEPHTIVLANFDPSALQVLLNMQAAAPAPEGKYQCFIPSGTGTMMPCTLTFAGKATGTLDGTPLQLKHWSLSLGPVTMDLYENGRLMQAAVASQSLAYTHVGFRLAPNAATQPPPGVSERELNFPSEGLSVPATLTMPAPSAAPPPIAVLVQGSGSQDRDETVGANRVFQQLAWALAQRGIATLRYDRRPKFAPASFKQHFDLDHEVVIDAASALAFCATLPDVSHPNIFLVGHSLGAQLAPYIVQRRLAQSPGSLRGYVMLAGVQTPIDQTLLRQTSEFGKAGGSSDQQINLQMEQLRQMFAQVRDPANPDSLAIGNSNKILVGYWRDWLRRDPAAVMPTLPLPVLVLRGENDRNVTHEDFTALAAAATQPGSHAQEFPGLNHLFMPTKEIYADPGQPGQIAPIVVDTIATWIQRLSAAN